MELLFVKSGFELSQVLFLLGLINCRNWWRLSRTDQCVDVVFHHDNGRRPVFLQLWQKLVHLGCDTIPQLLYSPDLKLSDYHSFPSIQNSFNGKEFTLKGSFVHKIRRWIHFCTVDIVKCRNQFSISRTDQWDGVIFLVELEGNFALEFIFVKFELRQLLFLTGSNNWRNRWKLSKFNQWDGVVFYHPFFFKFKILKTILIFRSNIRFSIWPFSSPATVGRGKYSQRRSTLKTTNARSARILKATTEV